MLAEIARQRLKQFGMGGRVRATEIIYRIHNAMPEEVTPHPVDRRFGKVRIRRRPLRQRLPRIAPLRNRHYFPIEERRHDLCFRPGMDHRSARSLFAITAGLVNDHPANLSHLAKKGCHPPKLILAPSLKRVVVTLGAIQPSPEEDPNLLSHDVPRARRQ